MRDRRADAQIVGCASLGEIMVDVVTLLTWAVAALSLAVVALLAVLGALLWQRRRDAAHTQSEQDLLQENIVHAIAEVALRQDALTREVRRHYAAGDDPDTRTK